MEERIEMITEWPITNSSQDKIEPNAFGQQSSKQQHLPQKCARPDKLNSSSSMWRGKRQYHPAISTCDGYKDTSDNQLAKASKGSSKKDSESTKVFKNVDASKYLLAGDHVDIITNSSSAELVQLQTDPQSRTDLRDDSSVHGDTSTPCEAAEMLVMPRLGRWWRREGHRLVEKGPGFPNTSNPNTLLFHVARLPEGRSFLKAESRELKRQLQEGNRKGGILAALASIEDWLGNLDEAVSHLKHALQQDPHNKEWQWLLHKTERQLKMRQSQEELVSRVHPAPVFPQFRKVERVSCKDLSFEDFFHQYALQHKPVVITDMVETMTTVPWDLKHIRDTAGSCEARVKRSVQGSVEWAGLEEARAVKVSQFLDNLHSCSDYLFDWSLPLHCPDLAQEVVIPRFFAGDFLQRSSVGSLYRDSWPSLFVAPPGVHSGLHVDAFASNFWMALFQGTKRWVFFQEEDIPCLYPLYAHSLDPTFDVNVNDPDLSRHPLLSLTHPTECILSAGEILFVPGGCPHIVQNLETTLAISANFVDLSNFGKVKDELEINALLDPRAADLLRQFQQPGFLSAMRSDIADLPWIDFKTWPPSDVDCFDMTFESVRDVREERIKKKRENTV